MLQNSSNTENASTFRVRDFSTGDEGPLFELFNKSFRAPIDLPIWNWKYRDHPWGHKNTVGVLHGQIVAHYGSFFLRAQYLGNEFLVLLPGDSAADPNAHHGLAYVKTASQHLKEIIESQSFEFGYGFPGNAVAGLARLTLGYQAIERPELLSVSTQDFDVSEGPTARAQNIRRHDEIPGFIDDLWTDFKKSVPLCLVRDRKYFEWRYHQKPGNAYTFYSTTDGESFFILKVDQEKISLMDYLYVQGKEASFLSGLTCIIKTLGEKNRMTFCLFPPKQKFFIRALKKNLILDQAPQDYLLVYYPFKKGTFEQALKNRELHYTLGDYDVY